MKCSCGSDKFYGRQIIRADIVVDETGSFYSNIKDGLESAIYDAGKPYGPFNCTRCNKEYNKIDL